MATEKKTRPLVVYGSGGYWRDERNPNRHQQARLICAAPSKAAIFRAYPELKNNEWTKTGNDVELKAALAKPMALLARGLDSWDGPLFEVDDFGNTIRR